MLVDLPCRRLNTRLDTGSGLGRSARRLLVRFPTTVVPQDADDLLKRAIDFVKRYATPAQLADAIAATRIAMEALLDLDYGKTWWTSWNNDDDTNVAGAIAIGKNLGDVRVLGFWQKAKSPWPPALLYHLLYHLFAGQRD